MGLLSSLFGKKVSSEEMIEKTTLFLSPQIRSLEEKNEHYVIVIGQEGIYYILCVAEVIAKRQIDDNELKALLLNALGGDSAIHAHETVLFTKQFIHVHNDLKNKIKPIAVNDVEHGMINSSNYLILQYQLGTEAMEKMCEKRR